MKGLASKKQNCGSFQNTGKFGMLHDFDSFQIKSVKYSEHTNSLSSENSNVDEYPNHRQQNENQFQKLIKLCQKLRNQNYHLKNQLKILSLKLSQSTNHNSPIQNFKTSQTQQLLHQNNQQNLINFGNKKDKKQFVLEIKQYKKYLYEEYKGKVRDMRSTFDYMVKCYLEQDKYKKGFKQILNIIKSSENNKLIKIIKIWKENRREEIIDGSSLQTNLYQVQCQQNANLRKNISQLYKITHFLLTNFRNDVTSLKDELSNNCNKTCSQFKRCMKKYFEGEDKKQRSKSKQKFKNISSISETKVSQIQKIPQKQKNVKKIKRPPIAPSHCKISSVSYTPKNSSTPKNNRSLLNSSSKNKGQKKVYLERSLK